MTKKNILIVDDRKFDRELLINVLGKSDSFSFFECSSAEGCLKMLDKEKIDLILMDIVMPQMNGNEVLPLIRKKFTAIQLPIIMVTVKDDPLEIVNCLQKGANDYITKPIHFEVALARVQTHIDLSELSKIYAKHKETTALNSLVRSYNHEINNCLSIAMACFKKDLSTNSKSLELLKKSIDRISDFVRKTEQAIENLNWSHDESVDKKQIINLK